MTHKLSCYHGHWFEVPQHTGRYAVCPLCGAVTRFRQVDIKTKARAALEPTLNQPDSAPLETSHDGSLGKTLNIDPPSLPSSAVLKTGSFDEGPRGDAQRPDTELDMSGGPTVGFKRTPNLDGPVPVVDDATSGGAGQTDSVKKSPNLDGTTSDSDGAAKSRVLPKTVTTSKTVSLDRPPLDIDSTGASNVKSGTNETKDVAATGG